LSTDCARRCGDRSAAAAASIAITVGIGRDFGIFWLPGVLIAALVGAEKAQTYRSTDGGGDKPVHEIDCRLSNPFKLRLRVAE
jgi:hypothetical protein